MSGRRVTIVDDDAATLALLRDILEADGFEVVVSTSVGADLRELWASRPDLLIVDLLLTTDTRGLSGWDVVRLARAHADLHRVPAIVISADYPGLRRHEREAGRMDRVRLLPKPFGVEELREVVVALLSPQVEAPRAIGGDREAINRAPGPG
ncbi:MAG TPA: response regulator [Candidatus Limnocylindria bacterium]